VGRPQTLYSMRPAEAASPGGYRLLAEMLCGLVRSKRQLDEAQELARQWGTYFIGQDRPKPGRQTGINLAVLQEAMAKGGFDPRFRRLQSPKSAIEVTLRDCPFRDLADEYRDLVCTLHRGLIEGMLAGLRPTLGIKEFQPFAERAICRVRAG